MSLSPIFYKRTKILATIGPAVHNYEAIRTLIASGVNGCRLNCSHGTNEERDQQIEWIRRASQELNKPVAILQDLQGPKIRLGAVEGKVEVHRGEEWQLTYGQPTDVTHKRLEVQYDLSQKMKVGERLYIFDGKIHSRVTAIAEGVVTILVENDGFVMARKGINVPDTDFGGDILTSKDLRDIEWGAARDIDYVSLSFVQSDEDIYNLRQILLSHGSEVRVIAKIETRAAIEMPILEAIVQASDGVMVARGDLAVEVGPEVVPIAQRNILGLCQQYGKLSIVATQMLMTMVDTIEPTRAEVSDIANAVIMGTDCAMLSEETANGSYPIEAVKTMKRIILYTQEHVPVRPLYHRLRTTIQQDAISAAAVNLAHQLNATAIVAETKSGATAENIATHRPSMPIVSVTSVPRVAQQLALQYANKSFLRPDGERAGLELAKELKTQGFFGHGKITLVLVSGRQPGVTGGTDTIRVRVLE